jgi:hypothetical protein
MLEKKSSTVFNKNSEERHRKRMKLLFIAFLVLLIVSAGMIAFLRKPAFQIGDIAISGARSLNPEDVRELVLPFIQGNFLAVIPRTNTLLFSKTGMKKFLIDRIPSITDASIDFTNRNLITITITEKKPDSVWCRNTDCYFIDQTGMIYEASPQFSDGVFVTFTGSTIPVGETPLRARFVPANTFFYLKSIIADLKQYPFSVIGVDLQDTGDIALRIDQVKNVFVNPHTQILITKDTSSKSIIDSMDLLLKNNDFTSMLSTKSNNLQYLDFRFPGKIYYKFNP